MRNFLDKLKAIGAAILVFFKKAMDLCRRFAIWISPPPRFCTAVIALLFVISLVSWAVIDRNWDSVLFFPQLRGAAIRGELRSLPRTLSTEKKAELIASEFLLGPMDERLQSAFPPGVRADSVLFRKGSLYIDLSETAAVLPPTELKRGLAALEKSVLAGLPQARRIILTIGGKEPYAEFDTAAPEAPKSNKKN